MSSPRNHIIVIAGPTAVGKTSLAVSLAQQYQTVVLSADSRQIYKGLDIGTAKPQATEMEGIKHYFIDHIDIEHEYSAGDFEREALGLLKELFESHQIVVVAGGSGLYIKALCEGMDDIPSEESVRERLKMKLDSEGLQPLLEELRQKDPDYYAIVDRKNPQRVIRALEVVEITGREYSGLRSGKRTKRPFGIVKIGLELTREELFDRIDKRMEKMIENGLFEEAGRFHKFRDLNSLQTVGYREIFDFLEGAYDKIEAVRLLKRNSRRYAKRQLTWFRKDPEFVWFEPTNYSGIQALLKAKLENVK